MENPLQHNRVCPKVKYNVDKIDVIIYTICKAKWYSGNPTIAYEAPIDDVIKAYQFEIMVRQYKDMAYELNKDKK